MVKLYTRQRLHITTKLLQGSSGTRAKIWSNYTQDKVYILQHSYSKAPVEQEPKFGQIIHKTKWLHITTKLLQGSSGTRAKIWSNYTQNKVYILQHSYSKAAVELEPKFGQIIHKTKSTCYNTATPRLQWNKSQNLVKLYTRQSLHTTTQLLQGSSGTRAKIWSNYTQDKLYILQQSYSKAPVEQEPKFGQIINKQSLHTTTQLLQGCSGTRAKIWSNYTQDKVLHTTTQLLQGSSGTRAKIWSNYTQDKLYILQLELLQGSSGTRAKIWSNYKQNKVYILQHSYSKAAVELEPKFGQIIHKQRLHITTLELLQGSSGTRAKIWSNYTQDKVYILQHSYSKAPVEQEPKFGQIIHKTKWLHITTKLLQGSSGTRAKIWSNYTQNKVYILQHSYSKAAVELEPKFGQIIHKTKSTCYNWSYSKAPVEQEPKFGQIIHKTKSTYYNTATPRLQWNKSQNLVKLYTRQTLHITTKLLQGSSGTRAKIWSNYKQTKSTYYNTATPRLQWN